MILAGYIGFLDPPKPSAAVAIQALQKHGVQVKILTGDNEIVTKKFVKKLDWILVSLSLATRSILYQIKH